MVFITQLVYILDGQEKSFHQFEELAIPLIANYNGNVLLRVRPGPNDYIEYSIDKPYEIHLVSFETEEDFAGFMQDEKRKEFLHLKERSVQSVLLIKGTKL